jgi:hypothetical protein
MESALTPQNRPKTKNNNSSATHTPHTHTLTATNHRWGGSARATAPSLFTAVMHAQLSISAIALTLTYLTCPFASVTSWDGDGGELGNHNLKSALLRWVGPLCRFWARGGKVPTIVIPTFCIPQVARSREMER